MAYQLFIQLLFKHWKRELRNTYSLVFTKTIILILLWHFSTSLMYYLVLHPSSVIQLGQIKWMMMVIGCTSLSCLFLPLAGYFADVKFSRYKVLLCSTYLMVASVIIIAFVFFLWIYTIHSSNSYYYAVTSSLFIVVLLYSCGNIIFRSNILQFGTDQLHDAPTQCSVLFLYAYLWCDNLCNALTLSTNIPGHDFRAKMVVNGMFFDRIKIILFYAVVGVFIASCTVVAWIVHRKRVWFSIENIGGNSLPAYFKGTTLCCTQ